MNTGKVFLGGTTKGPDWRPNLIELLKCEYFNPVVKDWNEAAQVLEKQAKEDCGISLYVITPFMEGVFSVAEMVEDSITRRNGRTVVCLLDGWQGKTFENHIKRSLEATLDMLGKYGCHVVKDLPQCAGLVNSLSTDTPTETYLLKNKWLSLKKLYGPTGDYVFSHEERCQGRIVSILPYVPDSVGQESYVIAREEFTPPWSTTQLQLSSITGGVDEGEDPVVAAARELFEETGMKAPVEEFKSLGTVRGAKSSDTLYYLYTVDVSAYLKDFKEVTGEDANEQRAKNVTLVPVNANPGIVDTILHSLLYRWERMSDMATFGKIPFQW
jgi:8-oxo-dGTP pyrophosphatase MutT (NUDIX family)